MSIRIRVLVIGVCLSLIPFASPLFSQTISIDLNEEHQTISGFGGMNHPYWIDDLTPDMVDKVFGNDPGQMGLSILRTFIARNRNDWDRVVPTAIRAKELGAIVFASPWTSPTYMKTNNDIVGGELLPEYYGEYANHLLDFASLMEANGVPMHAISLINEPDIDVSYHSMRWSSQQIIDFLKEQGPKFDSINLIVAESFNFNQNITNPILNDPDAEQYVDIIGGHIYGGGLADYPLAREKGKEVWMTEYLTNSDIDNSGNSWPLALNFATIVNNCMGTANFNAFVWWYIRRFYSIMDDAGNITKRGYAMSHFSKFIAPGYVRVGATAEITQNVDVTAYKSDTTLAIVVINRSNESVPIDFTIENSMVDSLVQFTSTATKNVTNEGSHMLSSGSFTATVDASSITTFTSYPNNAERFGNIPPVAMAGSSVDLIDLDNTGSEYMELNASASYDPDGEIANYSWSKDGSQIAWTQSVELDLTYGQHTFVLAVTDNDGARDLDTMVVTVSGVGDSHIWLEAECAQVGDTWIIHDDNDASEGQYAMMDPEVSEFLDSPSSDPEDHIVFNFQVNEAGNYMVWGRVLAPTFEDDSFWVRMNDESWARWNGISAGEESWHWNNVHDDTEGDDEGILYYLTTGNHTLTVAHRENGTGLDKVYITNTGQVPTELGEPAVNCDETTSLYALNDHRLVVYPNPATDGVWVNWDESFTSIVLLSLDGRVLLRRDFNNPLVSKYLPLYLRAGSYLLVVSNNRQSVTTRVIINP